MPSNCLVCACRSHLNQAKLFSFVLWWAKGIYWATANSRKSGVNWCKAHQVKRSQRPTSRAKVPTEVGVKSLWIKSAGEVFNSAVNKKIVYTLVISRVFLRYGHSTHFCQLRVMEVKGSTPLPKQEDIGTKEHHSYLKSYFCHLRYQWRWTQHTSLYCFLYLYNNSWL